MSRASSRFAPAISRGGSRGFTLLEMMVAISIITILMAIAIPTYNHSILVARESALRTDLGTLRDALWKYTRDKQKGPQSLDDLVTAGYVESIPADPITRQPNWEVEQGEVLLSLEQQDPGIIDVHSASSVMSSEGDAYSSW